MNSIKHYKLQNICTSELVNCLLGGVAVGSVSIECLIFKQKYKKLVCLFRLFKGIESLPQTRSF